MFQAYEQLLQRYPAFRTLPLAALTPPPQALEYLARCTIPTLSFVTPYRLEHPHSALVRKHAELTRQDTLYTPAGRLSSKYTRSAPEAPWVLQSSFVRRSSQLAALCAFCSDIQAVGLPESFFSPLNGDIAWGKAFPSPYSRLIQEWIEPRLASGLAKEPEGKQCLKTLDTLFEQEAAAFSGHGLPLIAMDDQLTPELAADPLWQRHASASAAALSRHCPDAMLAVTAAFDPQLGADLLPYDGIVSQLIPAFALQEADDAANRILIWLEAPPEASLLLLPPLPAPLYPVLLRGLGLAT